MRNNSTKYKFPNLFCIEIAKLSFSTIPNNYINNTQDNWNNYLILYNNNSESGDDNELINLDDLYELYGISD